MAESVIKGRKKGYTIVYNSVLKDTRLDLKTKGFFAVMMSFPDEWEYNIKGLSAVMGIGRDAVHKCLKQLEEAGYLMREQTRDGGRFSENVYVLMEESSSPCTEKPYTEKPSTETPYTENPHQYNKQVINSSNNIPPIVPQDGGRRRKPKKEPKKTADWKPERFEAFYAVYPWKTHRQEAIRAWDELKPSDELLDVMSVGLARQMASEEWQRGIGIPHPSTWLNNRRWEDQPKAPPKKVPESDTGRQWADK